MLVHVITDECPACGQSSELLVDLDALNAWRQGTLIQNAFPQKSAAWRETLKTGWHSVCWDKFFEGLDNKDGDV